MQFIIDSITSHTAKSVALYLGSMNVPYFVANGIFGFNRLKNIKSLEKQIQAIAPNGKKRTWRAEVPQLFDEIAKLNIEEPEEERGEFVGKPGDKITIMVKSCECVHSHEWVSAFGWRHNGHGWERPHGIKCIWKIVDMNDAVYMFSSSGNKINGFLSDIGQGAILESNVDYHSTFRGLRQTWITRPKTAK